MASEANVLTEGPEAARAPERLRVKLLGAALLLTAVLGQLLGYSVLDLLLKFSQAGRAVALGTCLAVAGALAYGCIVRPLWLGLLGRGAAGPVDWRRPAWWAAGGAVAALVVGLYAGLRPDLALPSFRRLAAPWADIPPPTLTRIDESDLGDRAVPDGGDLAIEVRTAGAEPRRATLLAKADGRQTAYPMARVGPHRFAATLTDVRELLTYRVVAGDCRSRRYRVDVYTEPRLESLRLRLVFPAYTGEEPRLVENAFGGVAALRGTRVELVAKANVPLGGGVLDFEAGGQVRLAPRPGQELVGTFVVERDDLYRFRLADEQGRPNREPAAYPVRALADAPPTVRLRDRELVAAPGGKVRLAVEGTDDFGLTEVGLVLRWGGTEKRIVLASGCRLPRAFRTEHVLDLAALGAAALGAAAGQTVECTAYAVDNDAVSGPKRGTSAPCLIRTGPGAGGGS